MASGQSQNSRAKVRNGIMGTRGGGSVTTVVTASNYSDDEKLQADFAENGYVLVRGGVSVSDLNRAKHAVALGMQRILGLVAPAEDSEVETFIDRAIIELNQTRAGQDELFSLHQSLRSLSVFHGFTDTCARLASRVAGNDFPFSVISSGFMLGLPDDSRLAYDFHQESVYMVGAEDIMNVHFPFMRASTVRNGTMSALEGSHLGGTSEVTRSKQSDNSYTNLVPTNIEDLQRQHREVAFHLELGDVALFHKDLVHKSNPNLSGALRPPVVLRLTQDLRYSFTAS